MPDNHNYANFRLHNTYTHIQNYDYVALTTTRFLSICCRGRPLIALFAQPFFPSLRPFTYNKHISTTDRATLVCATGHPSKVHFQAVRGSPASGKPFSPRRKGHPRPRTLLRVPVPTILFITLKLSLHAYVMNAHRSLSICFFRTACASLCFNGYWLTGGVQLLSGEGVSLRPTVSTL